MKTSGFGSRQLLRASKKEVIVSEASSSSDAALRIAMIPRVGMLVAANRKGLPHGMGLVESY